MEEKIKVYIPNSIYSVLEKDAELFEFYKKDGSINLNSFFNKLIINYFYSYQNETKNLNKKIKSLIENEISVDGNTINYLSDIIVDEFNKRNTSFDGKKTENAISIKPIKDSSDIISYIQTNLIANNTLSNYFRVMFSSYALLSRDKREKIIFSDIFESLNNAITNNKEIYITNIKGNSFTLKPYNIINSKDEYFNYLVGVMDKDIVSFRVSRIKKVIETNKDFIVKDSHYKTIDKMKKYGPQYIFKNDENELIKIKFTNDGIIKYEKMYLYRPSYIKKTNNIYYFDCSYEQIRQYLLRFGNEAEIISPKILRDEFKKYISDLSKLYK